MSCPSDPSVFVAPATERGRSGPAAGLEGAFLHHAVATIQNRSCACLHQDPAATDTPSKTQRACVFTTTWWPSKTCVGVSSPQRRGTTKRNVCISSPQRGGTPKPRVRLPGPVGRGAVPWGVDDSAIATPTGLNKMRSPHETRPDSSAGRNGGRGVGDVDRMGPRRSCRTPLGCMLDAARIPRVRPRALRRGAEPWALGCHHVVVKSFEWLPRCGEERRTAGRASIANSLIRSFFDGWRHSVCDSSYRGSLRINAWAERRLHNAARRNQRWAIRRPLIWTVAGSR